LNQTFDAWPAVTAERGKPCKTCDTGTSRDAGVSIAAPPYRPSEEITVGDRSIHVCRPLVSARASRRATRSSSASSHSHTVMTRQPSDRSSSPMRPSRATLPLSFASQNGRLVLGMEAFRQPSCWCQKHPCTKTTACRAGSTMSGLPGKSWRCREKRNHDDGARSAHASREPYRDRGYDSCSNCGALV